MTLVELACVSGEHRVLCGIEYFAKGYVSFFFALVTLAVMRLLPSVATVSFMDYGQPVERLRLIITKAET